MSECIHKNFLKNVAPIKPGAFQFACPWCAPNSNQKPKKSLTETLNEKQWSNQVDFNVVEKTAREYIYQENMEKLEKMGAGFDFTISELREVLK